MSEIRKQIHNKLSLLAKDITSFHILELDFQLGYIILSATLLGILIAIVLEVIFLSSKRKNKDE